MAGVVITSATLSSRMAKTIAGAGTSMVLFSRIVDGNAVSSVCCHNEQGAQNVARLLCRAGHQRLGIIGGLSAPKRPTALFRISDIMALGALAAAWRELSLSVPHDVWIVGFDDIPAGAWPSYDLTTAQRLVEAMVDEAIAILLRQIEDPSARPTSFRAPGTPIVRSSARL